MKNLFFVLVLLSVIMSCATLKKNYGIPDYQLGMKEQEFTESHKNNLVTIEATKGYTVYRRVTGFDSYTYYYFDDGKLVRMRRMDSPDKVLVVEPER